ncbi:mitogen-activated protein kinase kinase kinase 18-like [Tasmannia lanceolata]|uniref:mitogen-activated protein kinase kinase kinase 18-like n=1 Tax=Tasmannia lanceolata TaxID=3420 RepID=UPI004063F313
MDTCDWIRGPIIGRGSSATVSLASRTGELFAVKSAELARSDFLQREQRILSLLSCPHIVSYKGYDITTDKGKIFYNLFMEYVPGGTISEAINRQGGRLEESMIRSHTREILQGLSYLHSKSLVHCDIKGRNVLIGSDGCAKIADLGCARWVDVSGATNPISGTPLFMAPEVARGEEQGFPADVWALGCTMIEMATGRPPWPEISDPVSALYRIGYSDHVPDFPNWVSYEANDFLSKCLRRNAEERWTVDELLKHPFVDELGSSSKRIIDPVFVSNSPTSILDRGFWDSLENGQTHWDRTHMGSSSNGPLAERIRQLSGGISPSVRPDWTGEENWITVRRSEEGEDGQFLAGEAMDGGSDSFSDIHQELDFCIRESEISDCAIHLTCVCEDSIIPDWDSASSSCDFIRRAWKCKCSVDVDSCSFDLSERKALVNSAFDIAIGSHFSSFLVLMSSYSNKLLVRTLFYSWHTPSLWESLVPQLGKVIPNQLH